MQNHWWKCYKNYSCVFVNYCKGRHIYMIFIKALKQYFNVISYSHLNKEMTWDKEGGQVAETENKDYNLSWYSECCSNMGKCNKTERSYN